MKEVVELENKSELRMGKTQNDKKLEPWRGETLYIKDNNGYDPFLEQSEMLLIMPRIEILMKDIKPMEEEPMGCLDP